ncbi:hypothetical protein [Lolliginicoccus suaedae]|uniref:hypothetical protein n=1 Tax=Lolliginicoccus suaedae TaxID=2605429 RepID=UPI0011ED4051
MDGHDDRYSGGVDMVARWWDGAELWITGLSFLPQVAIVAVIVVPLCFVLARWLDAAGSAVYYKVLRRVPRWGSKPGSPPGSDGAEARNGEH